MTLSDAWFRFVISALAVWRVGHLLAAEDGPWDLIVRIRRKLGAGLWGRLMDCFYCLSLWISIPFAFFVVDGIPGRFVAWLALSGAACLAERLGLERLSASPAVFEETLDH
ncbi:MAG TPA: hypothetical protein VKV74_00465 [Bryobacteraceae bacterium]|nr:hypothetical protein [Bryobacteraceae bacterium]